MDFEDDEGLIFGDDDLVIGDNCDKKDSCSSNLGNNYTFKHPSKPSNTYLANKSEFQLKALFVFEMK